MIAGNRDSDKIVLSMNVLNDKTRFGIKGIAFFEAAKGLLVLVAGFSLFALIHQNLQVFAGQLVGHLHLNAAKHIPEIFLKAIGNLTDSRLLLLAVLAFLYSVMRFVEAYGLWFAKRWAQWFALFSGGVYLPVELYELVKGFSWITIVFVVVNLIVVLFMAVTLAKKRTGNNHY